METILEQKAIDSLFTTQAEGPAKTVASAASYNFGRSGHIGGEQMRAISLVNEQFARNLTYTLGAWLRSEMHIVMAAGEQMTYGDFLSCLPEPSYVCLLRLEPLGGVGLLELNLSVAMTMVDLLLGGRGGVSEIRGVTDIEDTILASVLEVVVRELNNAWETAGLRFTLEKHESMGRIQRLMPSSEQTLCMSLDLQMPGAQGMLNFCLPAMVLNTIQRRLSAMAEQPRKRVGASQARVEQLMGEASFSAVVRLPVMRIASRELQSLAVGKVLELPLPKSTPAELLIGGVRVCAALPAAKGDRLGAILQGDAVGVARSAVEEIVSDEDEEVGA